MSSCSSIQIADALRRSLATSSRTASCLLVPTVLVEWPGPHIALRGSHTAADTALAFYGRNGMRGDRIRRSEHGYPGLLRRLETLIGDIAEESDEELLETFRSNRPEGAWLAEVFGSPDSVKT